MCFGPRGETKLTTQTRIKLGTSSFAAGVFRIYWFFVRPMSGLIRIAMLRYMRKQIEAGTSRRASVS